MKSELSGGVSVSLLFAVVVDDLQPESRLLAVLCPLGQTSFRFTAVSSVNPDQIQICVHLSALCFLPDVKHRINMIDDPDLNDESLPVCLLCPLGTLKLSQTSPDVPNSEVGAHPHKDLPNAHSQQQVTSRSVGLMD